MIKDMQSIVIKSKKELDWTQSVNFEKGLELTVKWYLDNSEWMEKIKDG